MAVTEQAPRQELPWLPANVELLRVPSQPVAESEFGTPELAHTVEQLEQKIKDSWNLPLYDQIAGLAANQVGIDKRIVSIVAKRFEGEEEHIITMINPEIIFLSDEVKLGPEVCFSVREDVMGYVERSTQAVLKYQTVTGETEIDLFEDFYAVLVQHEIDHPDGLRFPDLGDRVTHLAVVPAEKTEVEAYKADPEAYAREHPYTDQMWLEESGQLAA